MKTHKKCKGTGKAIGFESCGESVKVETRKYGLCQSCFSEWAISTPEGDIYISKMLIQNKKKFLKQKKEKWNKEKLELKKNLETKTELERRLQTEINTIVRLIDHGQECISSGRPLGKNYDAGHLFSVGSNPTIRFNLFNIFAQSVHDNQHKSGNELQYFLRLKEIFGEDFQQFVLSLKQIKALHLSKDDIRDKTDLARGIIKWLKLQDRTFTKDERINIRSDINNQLGIYDQHWCEFKI